MLSGESGFLAVHAADSVEGMADALRQKEIEVEDMWPDDNIPYDGTEVWCLDRVITLTTFGCVNSHACTVSLGCWVEANVASPQSTWACEFLRQESHTLVRVLVSRRACSDGTFTQSEPFKECQTVAHRNRRVSRGLGSGFSSCSGPCNLECVNPGLYPVEDRDFPGDWVPAFSELSTLRAEPRGFVTPVHAVGGRWIGVFGVGLGSSSLTASRDTAGAFKQFPPTFADGSPQLWMPWNHLKAAIAEAEQAQSFKEWGEDFRWSLAGAWCLVLSDKLARGTMDFVARCPRKHALLWGAIYWSRPLGAHNANAPTSEAGRLPNLQISDVKERNMYVVWKVMISPGTHTLTSADDVFVAPRVV